MAKPSLEGPRTMTVYTKPYWWTTGTFDAMTSQVELAGGAVNSSLPPFLEYYTRDRIDMAGIAAEHLAVFPQGWSIQETLPPKSTPLLGTYLGDTNTGPNSPYLEIHDIWSSVEITEAQIFNELFATVNPHGPAFLSGDTADTGPQRYLDFEQVMAARSRVWVSDGSLVIKSPTAAWTEQYMRKTHDNTWGSGNPLGNDILYHVRAVRMFFDSAADKSPTGTSWSMHIPASIQPMLVIIDKPKSIAYLAMKQRSLDV